MSVRSRQIGVTLALMLLGAVGGSVVASGILAAAAIARNGPNWSDLGMAANIGCRLGVLFGAPLGPALGFNAFRHIPIGRAIVGVTVWPLTAAALGAMIDAQWAVVFGLVGLLIGPYWATRRR